MDTRILSGWLIAKNDPALFEAYRSFGLGRLKLLHEHIKEPRVTRSISLRVSKLNRPGSQRAIARIPSHLTSNAHSDLSDGSTESFASIGVTNWGISLI